jgi:hypothetical protein
VTCARATGPADAGLIDVNPTTTAMAAALNAETILFMIHPFNVSVDPARSTMNVV